MKIRRRNVVELFILLGLALYFLKDFNSRVDLVSNEELEKLRTPKTGLKSSFMVIQLGLVLHGQDTILRAQTMLKSLLFYQGRTGRTLIDCENCSFFPPSSYCRRSRSINSLPVRIHAVVSSQARKLLNSYIFKENLTAIHWTLYSFNDYMPLVALIHNTHGSGPSAFLKLLWPFITQAEKLLTLDTDILFNYDVADLWKSYDRFDGNQTLGLAYETAAKNSHFRPDREHPFPRSGLNSGVILWDMKKMRLRPWISLLRGVVTPTFSVNGDQIVLNRILRQNPSMYYTISCEWHVQVYNSAAEIGCPVVWPDWLPDQEDCLSLQNHVGKPDRPNLLLLAHYNKGGKPESLNWTEKFQDTSEQVLRLNKSLTDDRGEYDQCLKDGNQSSSNYFEFGTGGLLNAVLWHAILLLVHAFCSSHCTLFTSALLTAKHLFVLSSIQSL